MSVGWPALFLTTVRNSRRLYANGSSLLMDLLLFLSPYGLITSSVKLLSTVRLILSLKKSAALFHSQLSYTGRAALVFFKKFSCLFLFETERDRARVGEGQREGETQNLKQAPGSERSAQSPMRGSNSRLRDHDLIRSRTLNQLNHPGAPE